MRIRPFRTDDAAELAEIFHSAINQIARHHYSDEQVRAWASNVPDADRFVTRGSDGRILLVAVDENDRPMAYGDLESDGHIDHLFCSPEVAGTGVAAQLYDTLENAARSRAVKLLYVEASEPARRFFLKHGFVEIERRDFELEGVPMHNFRMEKRLRPEDGPEPGVPG